MSKISKISEISENRQEITTEEQSERAPISMDDPAVTTMFKTLGVRRATFINGRTGASKDVKIMSNALCSGWDQSMKCIDGGDSAGHGNTTKFIERFKERINAGDINMVGDAIVTQIKENAAGFADVTYALIKYERELIQKREALDELPKVGRSQLRQFILSELQELFMSCSS